MNAPRHKLNTKNLLRKGIALMMTVMMCISLLSVSSLTISAGETPETAEETVSMSSDESCDVVAADASKAAEAAAEEGTAPTEKDQTSDEDVAVETAEKAAAADETTADETTADETTASLIDQTIHASIYYGTYYVREIQDETDITLSGMMPEGAVAKASPVDVEIEGIEILAAYDITIFDAEGEEYQPADGAIRVEIENSAIKAAEKEDNDLYVYHMENKKAEPELVSIKEAKGGSVAFDADSFSIYVVGEDEELYETDGETPHYVYKLSFYIEDESDQPISAQTVSPGEYVEMPAVPDKIGYEFDGWYSDPNGGGEKYLEYTNAMPEITDEQDHEINLYAHYSEIHYVHYMTHEHEESDENTRVIFHSEAYSSDQTLDTSTAESFYLSEGYLSYIDETTGQVVTELAVTGWLDENGKEWKTGDTIDWQSEAGDLIDGDLLLYPIVQGAYWVYYDMNGHDSVENPEPEYVLASETYIGTLPEPEVSGYTFDGWYTKAEGGNEVINTTTLESLPKNDDGSITLYAHWTETYVAYTINIWRQKATDGKQGLTNKEIANGETYDDYIGYYDYAESHYVSAAQSRLKTGDTPTTSTVDSWSTYTGYGSTSTNSNNYRNHPDYYGFEYSNTKAQTRSVNELATKTMAADGSTIINIYYNRVTITWNFGTSQSSTRTGTLIGLYDTNVSLADDVEPGGTLSSWPANSNNNLWKPTYSGSVNTTFKARFDIDGGYTTVSFRENSFTRSHYLYFYLEVTNEDTQVDEDGSKAQEAANYRVDYTRTVNNTLYVYNQRTGISSGSFNFTDKYAGYYLVGYIDDRNGATQTTYTSTSAGGSHSFNNNGYVFNNAITTNTITLISSDKVVGVDAAGDAIETSKDVTYPDANHTVKYGAAMSNYPFPETLDGEIWGPAYYYHYVGWFEDPMFTAPFSITTMPNNNVVAYADWELNEITVTFNTGTSEVEAPETQELTATQKAADPGTLKRDGYTHVGWADQNGKVFNFDTVLYGDTTLTAIWKADDESGYTMKYDLNVKNSYGLLDSDDYPEGEDKDASINTDHFTVNEELWTIEKAFEGLDQDVYDMFIGWNTAADGTGTMYYPYDDFTLEDVEIDNEGHVTLYAIWAHKNESALIIDYVYPEGYLKGYDGETQQILIGDNLTSIDLYETSGLKYHDEITVTDSEGKEHTYRFDGWSTTDPGNDPTDEAVDIAADATVAVDTLGTSTETNANYLFAVWMEVHEITVTKEVVNDSLNYTVPENQTFTFTWSFIDGEGEKNTNEKTIIMKDGEIFTIPDVATGEKVTITETPVTGFTTSYTGVQLDVKDDGNGTCTFTMTENSQNITVYNTVETTKLTAEKVWADEGQEGVDHNEDSVRVTFKEGGEEIENGTVTLSENNNWQDSIEVVLDSSKEYTVEETAVKGYTNEVTSSTDSDTGDMTFTITNTPILTTEIDVTKVWEDNENQDGKRDDYTLTLTGTAKGAADAAYTVTQTLDQNTLEYTFTNVPTTDAQGNSLSFSVSESVVPDGYTAEVTGDAENGFTVTNTHEPEKTTVSGTKVWDDSNSAGIEDADGDRPAGITIRLYVGGEPVKDKSGEDVTAVVTAEDGWTFSFEGLDKYADGKEIQYTITEDAIYHYSTSYSTSTNENGTNYVVTNTHASGKTSITVQKVWRDDSNRDGVRPDSVTIDLMADGEQALDKDDKPITLTLCGEGDVWTGTFDNLDIYEGDATQAIAYSIVEEGVDTTGHLTANEEYTSVVTGDATEGYIITNTCKPELINENGTVTFEKVWEDADNQDGIRPDSVSVTLIGTVTVDGDAGTEGTTDTVYISAPIELNDGNSWTETVSGLYKYANGGQEITYTVTEAEIALPEGHEGETGYNTTYSGGANANDKYTFTVTNTHETEVYGEDGTFTMSKIWNDGNNSANMRSRYDVTLTGTIEGSKDPVYTDTQTLFSFRTSYTWSNLAKYSNGNEITYTLEETTVPDGYVASYSDETEGVVTITNTLLANDGTGEISVAKIWQDAEDTEHDPITVTLIVNEKTAKDEYGNEILVTLNGSNEWKGTFTDLPGYTLDGQVYSYSISEVMVPEGYDSKTTGSNEDGWTITNTKLYTPDIPTPDPYDYGKITVTKEWDDDSDRDGIRPDAINVSLLANGDTAVDIDGNEVSLTWTEDGNTWTATANELPGYDAEGEIIYTVSEETVDKYTTAYNPAASDIEAISSGKITDGTVTITNTHTPEMVDDDTGTITVEKVWDDEEDQDGIRPDSVFVTLKADDKEVTTFTLSDLNNWTDRIPGQYKYANGGEEIVYSVTEAEIEVAEDHTGYSTEITGGADKDNEYTFTVTNTHEPEEVTVSGTKTWDDEDNQDGKRPQSITVNLMNGSDTVATQTVTANNEWTYTFSNLPKYADGTEVIYTISEDAIDKYTTTYNGYDITNSYTPNKVGVTVTKSWEDDNDRDGIRPESVTVTLVKDGTLTDQTLTLSESDGWKDTFTDLDEYANGTKIEYTVQETDFADKNGDTDTYDEPVITGDADSGYVITNTHTPELINDDNGTVSIKKVWDDANNQDGIRPDSVTVTLTGTIGEDEAAQTIYTSEPIELSDTNSWTTSINDLYKYANGGEEITYTVTEDEITVPEGHGTGYDAVITGGADEENEYTFTVTNKHTPEVIGDNGTITITKTWNDEDDHDAVRPTNVYFTLTGTVAGDGDEEVTVDTNFVTLTSEGGWTGTIEGLARYSDGQEITYTLTEDEPEGYTSVITAETDIDGIVTGYTVVNSHDDYTATVTVTKEWEGDEGYEAIYRPSSVTVHLMSDGVDTNQSVVLIEENNWTGKFENVPVFEDGDEQHGQQIIYTVTEENLPAGYTASETESELVLGDDGIYTETATIINTFNTIGSAENPVTITKEWNDGEADHTYDSVSVTIYSSNWTKNDGSYYISEIYTLDEKNDWTVTVSDLPKYTTDNEEIEYVVSEEAVESYSTQISGMVVNDDGSSTFTVTNTALLNGTGELKVSKIWSDANDQDGIRPDSVTVQLYTGEGDELEVVDGETLTLDETNGWTDSFTELDQYDADGQENAYTVKEINFADKNDETNTYTTEVTGDTEQGFTVTNTHTPETIDISGTKTWDDANNQEGKRPTEITVNLMNGEKTVASQTVTAAGNWSYTFTGVDKYASGEEINYTISEDAFEVEGYSTTYDGYNVKNSYTPGKTCVTVTKAWDDAYDQDGFRPDSVTVALYADNVDTGKTVTLNEGNNWQATFTGLDEYASGQKITYTVQEINFVDANGKADTYEPTVNGNKMTGYFIINTHTPEFANETGDITVTKTWDDNNNQDGIRDNYEVILAGTITVDGVETTVSSDTQTLSADTTSYTWKDMPKYSAGVEIEYSVTETTVPEGYEATYGGDLATEFTVTNTHTPATYDEVTVTKEWVDDENRDGMETDTIDVQLYAGKTASGAAVELSANNSWTYTWENLPQYANGEEIDYSVQEMEVPDGYTVAYTGDVESGFTITNSHTPETVDVEGSKTWDYGDDPDTKPASITVHLLADGTETDSATVTEAEGWAWSFTDLLKNASGKEITYTITEDAIENYTTEIDGYDVTNTYNPEMTTVTVSKGWDDDYDRDGLRPDYVTVTLTGITNSFSEDIVLNEGNKWTATVDVPMYDNEGKLVEYSVSEEQVENYDVPVIDSISGTSAYNFIVTNTHKPVTVDGDDGTITIKKVWDDENDQDGIRPESVSVTLTGTVGTGEGDDVEIETVYTSGAIELNDKNEWTVAIDGLYKYAGGGQEIAYSVSEAEIALPEGHENETGYIPTFAGGADEKNAYTFTVTNKHVPEVYGEDGSLTVKKVWNDDDNRDGMETDSITVQLEIDQKATGDELTLNSANSWTGAFINLPKYADGKEINYSVEEAKVPDGYTATYTQTGNDWTITNSHTPETVDVDGSKTWDDNDDADGVRPEEITIRLYADGTKIDTATVTEDDDWAWSFTNLPKYRDGGVEIEYTITEDAVYHYSTTYVENYDVTNTHAHGKTSVTLTKIWNDVNDRDKVRPESVTIDLLADGEEVLNEEGEPVTMTLSGEGNVWTGSFTGLDIYEGDETQIIEYSIEEEGVGEDEMLGEYYTSHIDGDASTGFIITNKHDVTDWTVEKTLTNSGTGTNGAFNLGETAQFTITVTNTGNTDIDEIQVTETLDGAIFIESAGYTLNEEKTVATITDLAEGESAELYAEYTIEEKDLGKVLTNSVTTTDGDPDDPAPGGETPIPTEDMDPHLTITKTTTSTPDNGEAYTYGEEITYEITVTNDGNLTITDITVSDELTEDTWTIDSLAPGLSETFTTFHKVTMADVENGFVVNEATVSGTSPDPSEPDVPSDPGIIETDTEQIEFYPMDEEIVPGNDDEANPGSWIDRESVNEYESIEIEMSTTLPNVSGGALAAGDFSMTFHNKLVSQLILDELDSDFTVDINGTPIDHQYYEIDRIRTKSLMQFFRISDGCTFHVNVDLTALYNDGVIGDADLGTGTVRVFFYTDLETTDVNGSYTSTAWYDVLDGEEVLYISDESVVTVYTFEIIVDAYDENTGAPLSGVEFGLYYDEECTQPVSRNGEPYIVTTDENGQAMFVGIAEGACYVKELKKPDGYKHNGTIASVILAGDENSNHIFEVGYPYKRNSAPQNTTNVNDDDESNTDTAGTSVNGAENGGSGGNGSASGTGSTKTSDTNRMDPWLILLLIASVTVVTVVSRRKKRVS